MTTGHDHTAHQSTPGGVLVADGGHRLVLGASIVDAGRRTVEFTIVGPDGRPVRDYIEQHDKELHLIAVGRDLSGFQHVHPVRDEHGMWRTEIDLTPGTWRILADVVPAGAAAGITLGADLFVPGAFRPEPLPAPAPVAEIDGYTVTLDGALAAGEGRHLVFRVTRGGTPVDDLEPYLAAYGHLVALRAGDLAYLHVHPGGAPGDGVTPAGPEIAFHAAAPTPGDYRLYLDFQHDGLVHTAAFTVAVADPAPHAHRGHAHPNHAHSDHPHQGRTHQGHGHH